VLHIVTVEFSVYLGGSFVLQIVSVEFSLDLGSSLCYR